MLNPNKILLIIQRSNGDVFLSLSLINSFVENYKSIQIDLLVNDDTIEVAKLLPYISKIHTFSYFKKKQNNFKQEKSLIFALFRKYDLSISLTASDRSVAYALLASKYSISAVDNENQKSWWKKIFLTHYYPFDASRHILLNNLEPLNLLNIKHEQLQSSIIFSNEDIDKAKTKLEVEGIDKFIIFHPSAQYDYKIYPKKLRDKLLGFLNTLGLPIVITGGRSEIDLKIKDEIPNLDNIYNFIGRTSLKECFIFSQLSLAYIGMDTLNMHIAASQNKRIFAIFGPTNLSMWSPWSNELKSATIFNKKIQTYGLISIFQGTLPCVACGMAGCDDNMGKSKCLDTINPEKVFQTISNWYQNV